MSLIIGGQNTRPLKTQGGQNCVLGGLTITLTDIPLKWLGRVFAKSIFLKNSVKIKNDFFHFFFQIFFRSLKFLFVSLHSHSLAIHIGIFIFFYRFCLTSNLKLFENCQFFFYCWIDLQIRPCQFIPFHALFLKYAFTFQILDSWNNILLCICKD